MKISNLLNVFKKTNNKAVVEKSLNINTIRLDQLINGTGDFGTVFWSPTSILEALRFYSQLQPVFDSVDRIVTEFSSIKPTVRNTQTKEFFPDHPILKLLEKPNAFDVCDLFLKTLATDFLVTGNAFYTATGNLISKPLELFNVLPQTVSVLTSDPRKVEKYQISDMELQREYTLTSVQRKFGAEAAKRLGPFRYYWNNVSELFHLKDVNRLGGISSNRHFGMNRVTPLFFEVDQHKNSSIHNLSILKRGGRTSGILVSKEPLTEDQREALQKEFNDLYTGSENAGRALLIDGSIEWKDLMKTNRDMDFLELKKSNVIAIYNVFRVPLALVIPEQMTLSNFFESRVALYEGAVIPLTKFLYSKLTAELMPRYENSENLELTFDLFQIPTLEAKRVKTVAEMANLGILTINELRTLVGREKLENGDEIFLPANLLPLLRDTFTQDNLRKPNPGASGSKFKEILQLQVDGSGNRVYDDAAIKILTNSFYGQ